jgi:hypothetical protein
MTVHHDLAAGRWWTLSLSEQLGNVGSEISRALKWSGRNSALAEGALFRALDLFDLTLADPRHRPHPARLREIARAREVVVDLLAGPNEFRTDGASLQKYFDAFALAARRLAPAVETNPAATPSAPARLEPPGAD